MRRFVAAVSMVLMGTAAPVRSAVTSSITQFGITWTFASPAEYGQFANGDYWVVGPVTITSISNSLNDPGFTPRAGQNGSMINPPTNTDQGYNDELGSYEESLNAGRPNGQPLSAANPLVLPAGSSLVSAVSWLYISSTTKEPGCPGFNGGTNTPRPVLRAAAVLTTLAAAPPSGSLRPPYCGTDKTVRFNQSQLRGDLLPNLAPVASLPTLASVEDDFFRPWIDHVNEYLGAFLHPSNNMPQYGEDVAVEVGRGALMLLLDFNQLPGAPSKLPLLTRYVQLGIDLAGIADNGGSWPSNGGHQMGRKWPILFAGLMLDDAHMKGVGGWSTVFQEDGTAFHVTQQAVDITHGPSWDPDVRATPLPYEIEHIGLPEWGIRHNTRPQADNFHWSATYRDENGRADPGFVLAARLMGQEQAWDHPALFDYIDRWVNDFPYNGNPNNEGFYRYGGNFQRDFWLAYRDTRGPGRAPLNAAAAAQAGGIALSWQANPGNGAVSGYRVYRSADRGETYSQVGQTTGTGYTDSQGLVSGTQYHYWIRAYDANGESTPAVAYATAGDTTPGDTMPPARPRGLRLR